MMTLDHIGKIIKLSREKKGISQKDLAKDICSSKYVFLIEKGERNPSTFLMRQFSGRLNVNLFDLYQYIDCINPIDVYETIELFEKYKSNSDYEKLKLLSESKKSDSDFKRVPLCCEILINNFTYQIFVENAVEEAVFEITNILSNFQKYSNMEFHRSKLYFLLALCYQRTNNTAKWAESNKAAFEIIQNKESVISYVQYKQYFQLVTTISINKLFLLLKMNDIDHLISEAGELLRLQLDEHVVERMHYTYFFLTVAHCTLNNQELAYQYFKYTIFITLLGDRPEDVRQFLENKIFRQLIDVFRDHSFITDFLEKYRKSLSL